MIRYKIDILQELKKAGYSTTRIRRDKIIPEGTLTSIRLGECKVSYSFLDRLCSLLGLQPADIIEYIPDNE